MRRRAALRLALEGAILAGLIASGCTTTGDGDWRTIAAGTWVLEALEADPPIDGSRITLRLEGSSRLFGDGGVNRYFGTYERIGSSGIRPGSIASTRMASSPELMEQEARYLALLARVDQARLVEADQVSLELLSGDAVLLTYRPLR